MKLLFPLLGLALVGCDRPMDAPSEPGIMATKLAKLEAENEALKAEVEMLRKSPSIPLGEEAAIRLMRLTMDPGEQDPKRFHDDQSWLGLNVFHPLRKVYDDAGQTEMFDAWTQPVFEEFANK